MKLSMIPWHVFLYALKRQSPATLEAWLGRWRFTNEGVTIAAIKR